MYRPSALHALRPSQFQLPVCTSQEPPEVPVFTGGALENCSLSRRGKTWGKLTAGRVPHWKCKRNRPPFVLILLIFVEKLLQGPPFTSQLQNSMGTAAIFLCGIYLMPWNYSLPETHAEPTARMDRWWRRLWEQCLPGMAGAVPSQAPIKHSMRNWMSPFLPKLQLDGAVKVGWPFVPWVRLLSFVKLLNSNTAVRRQ